jgi:hypothetical protein
LGDTIDSCRWFALSLQRLSTAPGYAVRVTTSSVSSHEVTVPCRVLAKRPVLPYWLDNPSSFLRWPQPALNLEVFPEASLRPKSEFRALSSRRVAPPSEYDRAVPPPSTGSHDRADRSSSHGVSRPFDASGTGGATIPELTSLRLLRSQGFSPSQRFAPRRTVRPCFMPVASMGFRPSELSPLEKPYRLSAAVALLMFPFHPSHHTHAALPHETGRSPPHASRFARIVSSRAPVSVITLATSECLHRRSRPRPRSSPSPAALSQPTAGPPRPCRRPKSLTVRVKPCCRLPRAQAVRSAGFAPAVPRACPEHPARLAWLPVLIPGAGAPWTRSRKPRRSQHLAHAMPGARKRAEAHRGPFTPWFEPSGNVPPRSWLPARRSAAASRFEPTRQSLDPDRRVVRPTSRSSWFVRCDCRSFRRRSGLPQVRHRTEVRRLARVRSEPPVPPPRPPLAVAAPGPKPVCRAGSAATAPSGGAPALPTATPCRSTALLPVLLACRSRDLDHFTPRLVRAEARG